MLFFKNKPILITAAVVVLALLFALVSHFTGGGAESIGGEITSVSEGFVSKLFSPVRSLRTAFSDKEELIAENDRLKAEIDELIKQNRGANEYLTENKRLKDLLGIKETMVNKELLAAQVISYDWDNFSETVTINRGKSDGVEKEDAVVSALGVIGRVSEVGANWARITTLLSPKHSLGVKISRTGDLAVAEGDIKLFKDNKLRLDYISGEAELIEGDILETTGIGGIYPPGLTVGRISEIKKDSSGAVNYAVVEPTADFTRIFEVLVITEWTRESITPDYVINENVSDEIPEIVDEITDIEIENAEG